MHKIRLIFVKSTPIDYKSCHMMFEWTTSTMLCMNNEYALVNDPFLLGDGVKTAVT